MKKTTRVLSAILFVIMIFSALVPCITAFAESDIIVSNPTLTGADPTYTRKYSFNDDAKKAENDRILNEPGAWHSQRDMSFISAFESLRTNTSMNNKFGSFSSLGTAHSSWTIDTSDSNYVSIPSITQSHPRLLVTKDTIPVIRKALEEKTTTNERFFELLDTSLEDVNSFKLDSIATIEKNGGFGTDSANPTYDGRAGKHNYRKDYLEIIQIKALGYLVDGHELYGYQAIHGIKQFLNSLDVTNSSYYIKTNMEREHGNIAFTAALVFDWCYPLLNDVDKAQIMAAVQNIALKGTMPGNDENKMHCGYPPFSDGKAGAVAGHGSEREILRDYLSVAVAFYGESGAKNISKSTANSWWTYVSKLVYSQYVPVRNYYFNSGVAPQGLGVYVSGRHISDMYSAWILKTATGTQPYANIDKTVRNFLEWEVKPDFLFSDGDGNYVGKQIGVQNTYELRSLAYMTAYIFNDDAMLTQARTMPDNTARASDPYYNGVYGADTIELTSAMYVALTGMSDMTYNPDLDKYEGMSLIQYSASPLGQYVTHEAYGVEDSASAYMRIKERYTANHEHLDAGTFMIYYKGMLTADTGVYASYGGAHQRYYHTATVSHNGLLIFDSSKYNSSSTDLATKWYSGGQIFKNTPASYSELKSDTWKAGKVVGHRHAYTDSTNTQPLYAYISGNITPSYDSDTVTHVGRRMLTVYTGDEKVPMLFFTYDSITATSKTYEQKFLLQIPSSEAPIINTTNKTVKTENGGGQLVLNCITDGVTINGVGGGTGNNYLINGNQNTGTDLGTWGRVEIVFPQATSNKVLNAMYVTDAGTETYYKFDKITNVSTGSFASNAIDLDGCVFNNSIAAVFTKKNLTSSSNFVDCSMSFTTPGSGMLSYYVDGLKGGNWNITVTANGTTYVTTAKASNGLLTFTAPAGAVVLTKEAEEVTTLKDTALTTLGSKIANDGSYSTEAYAAYVEAYDAIIAKLNAATTTSAVNAIDIAALKAEAEAKLSSSVDDKKAELKNTLGSKISNSSGTYTSDSYALYSSAYDSILASINNATTMAELNAIDVSSLKASAEAKLVTAVDAKKAELIAALGSKKANTNNVYTSASYALYSSAYEDILSSINNATTLSALNVIDVSTLKASAEAKLVTSVADLKEALKAELGAMITNTNNAYTSASYSEYTSAYNSILNSINNATTVAALNAIDVAKLKANAEAKLVTPVAEKKAELLAALGEKKPSTGFTASSYAEYSAKYNEILASINNASDIASLESLNVVELKAAAESKLTESSGSEGSDISGSGSSGSKDVYISYEGNSANSVVYSVDVVWTDISFTYTEGSVQWDPENHEYTSVGDDSGWSDSTGEITVINHSNAAVAVNITFTKSSTSTDNVQLLINNSQFTIESAEKYVYDKAPSNTANIVATGTPSKNTTIIGKITVQINKAS